MHELGHAIMCIPFGHKIKKICLWNPKAPNGVLGYVKHTYNKKNPWHKLGCLFISIGPIIMGLGVVTLTMLLCFGDTIRGYYDIASSVGTDAGGVTDIFSEGIRIIPSAIADTSSPTWAKIVGGLIILCVCMHINLSPADIKNSLGAIPVYSLICLVVSLSMFIIGIDASAYSAALLSWCWICLALYMVVFAGVVVLLAIALVCFIIGKLIGR